MLLALQRRRPNTSHPAQQSDWFPESGLENKGTGIWSGRTFLLRPPVFMVPGAVCRAKVGLEMVKHNGDSVRPEGPQTLQLSNSGNQRSAWGSPVHQQSEEIGVKNVAPYFLKQYFSNYSFLKGAVLDIQNINCVLSREWSHTRSGRACMWMHVSIFCVGIRHRGPWQSVGIWVSFLNKT